MEWNYQKLLDPLQVIILFLLDRNFFNVKMILRKSLIAFPFKRVAKYDILLMGIRQMLMSINYNCQVPDIFIVWFWRCTPESEKFYFVSNSEFLRPWKSLIWEMNKKTDFTIVCFIFHSLLIWKMRKFLSSKYSIVWFCSQNNKSA